MHVNLTDNNLKNNLVTKKSLYYNSVFQVAQLQPQKKVQNLRMTHPNADWLQRSQHGEKTLPASPTNTDG